MPTSAMILLPEYMYVSDRTEMRKHMSLFKPLFLKNQKYDIVKVVLKKIVT